MIKMSSKMLSKRALFDLEFLKGCALLTRYNKMLKTMIFWKKKHVSNILTFFKYNLLIKDILYPFWWYK